MIAHIVLFQPRADLSTADRESFALAFERAITEIPQVKRARIGERKNFGRFYDRQNMRDFPYAAIIEFESEQDLLAYLDHPAHEDLGRRFYDVAAGALAFDYELMEGEGAAAIFRR